MTFLLSKLTFLSCRFIFCCSNNNEKLKWVAFWFIFFIFIFYNNGCAQQRQKWRILNLFSPGQSVHMLLCVVPLYSVCIINGALTQSVSTSQRQMGLLMQWCSYVRPAIAAAAPVCLYCSTEREAENAKGNLRVAVCVCTCMFEQLCMCSHTHVQVCVQEHCGTDGGWCDESVWIDLLSWVWWTLLFKPSPSIPCTLGNCRYKHFSAQR